MQRNSPGKDGGHRKGGEGSSTPPKKGDEGRLHAASFLGSTLWDKTIPYDPDLKVTLEHMELEDFLTENEVIPLDDQSVQKSLDFLSQCETDSVSTPPHEKSSTGYPVPSTSYSSNRHPSTSSSTYSSPLHTPPSSSPAYNVPSPPLVNPADTSFNFPSSSNYNNNNHNGSPINHFLTSLGNRPSSYSASSPSSTAGHLTDLSNNGPNQGSSNHPILKEANSFFGQSKESSTLSDSSNSNDKSRFNGRTSPLLNLDACSQLLFGDTDLPASKPSPGETSTRKRNGPQSTSTNKNNASIKDMSEVTSGARASKRAPSGGKRWPSFSSEARAGQKGRGYNAYDSNPSVNNVSEAFSIFDSPPTPSQTLTTFVKKRAYNKEANTSTPAAADADQKPKVECIYGLPLSNQQEPSDDSSCGSVGSRNNTFKNTAPPRRRGAYGLGKRQAAAVAAIALAPDTPSPPNSPTCSSPNSSRSSCYSPQPPHSPNDEDPLSEMASVPGRESFNPRTRRFTGDELKPQPMVKKSRKQYVPPDLKDDKYWARRRKNNVAAKRSRDARRIKENQIALRANFLEDSHQKMARDLEAANRTVEMLKKRLAKYEPV